MASALFPLLQKFAQDEWIRLDRSQITPWAFFNSGKPFQITDFYGKGLASEGIEFTGSIRDVYWHRYIEPFIEDITDRGFTETLNLARDRGQMRPEPFEEMGGQLIALSRKAFRRMVDIDQRIRGKGDPQSVPTYNPEQQLADVTEFIRRRMIAEIAMIPDMNGWSVEGASRQPWADLSGKLDQIQSALEELTSGMAGIGHNQPPLSDTLAMPLEVTSDALASIEKVRKELIRPEEANGAELEKSANLLLAFWIRIKKLTGKAFEGAASGVGRSVATVWLKEHPAIVVRLIDAIGDIFRWIGRIVG